MKLDLVSFVLEILNFLVLLWVLKRFLYSPIQAAIAKRQQGLAQAQAELEAARRALAEQQQGINAERIAAEARRDAALAALATEVDTERKRRLKVLDADIAAERLKLGARMAVQEAQQLEVQDRAAADRAEGFLRQYIGRLAVPAVECAVIDLFLADLAKVPEARRQQLADIPEGSIVDVATAFEMDAGTRRRVEQAISALLARNITMHWLRDPAIVAGISVRLDGHVLEASLGRSLEAFRSSAAGL